MPITISIPETRCPLDHGQRTPRLLISQHLVAVADDRTSLWSVITCAAQPGSQPLRTISLKDLLSAQPDWGVRRAESVLESTSLLLDMNQSHADITVGWIIDARTDGARAWAFLTALHQPGTEVGPRFPYD